MVSRAALCRQFCLAMAVGYWLAGPLLLRLRRLSPPPTPLSLTKSDSQLEALPLKQAGSLQPVESAGPFDLDRRRGLRAAVAARAHGGELVLFTSNGRGIPSAVNMALQLRRLSIEHHLVLADTRETCSTAQRTWPWLGCGWSHGMGGFSKRYGDGPQVTLWELWSAKWLTVARLAELRVNVLALDTDMMLLEDPYPLLRSEDLRAFSLVLPPEGSRVNLGFLCAHGGCNPAWWRLQHDVVEAAILRGGGCNMMRRRPQHYVLQVRARRAHGRARRRSLGAVGRGPTDSAFRRGLDPRTPD